jgi:hypothetical protein
VLVPQSPADGGCRRCDECADQHRKSGEKRGLRDSFSGGLSLIMSFMDDGFKILNPSTGFLCR